MDFSKLSEETMNLSNNIGPRQQKLLFDHEFFDEEVTFRQESNHSPEVSSTSAYDLASDKMLKGPGVVFFVDLGGGSFCVRGLPVVQNNLDLNELRQLNHHFEKTESVNFFPCDSIEVAEVITEQMINRRYPLQDNGLVNISDPGSTWLLSYGEDHLSLYFKSMGHKERGMENLGAIGDPQIFRFWWNKISKELKSDLLLKFESDEKGCHLKLDDSSKDEEKELFQILLNILLLGDIQVEDKFFSNLLEFDSIRTYFNELSHSRRFWLKVEEILSL